MMWTVVFGGREKDFESQDKAYKVARSLSEFYDAEVKVRAKGFDFGVVLHDGRTDLDRELIERE